MAARKNKSLADRVKDPTGRLDWLLSRLIQECVRLSPNPYVQSAFAEFQPQIEATLRQYLGPRNRNAKLFRRYLIAGQNIMAQRGIR